MSELTDLEICQRIVEIEGEVIEYQVSDGFFVLDKNTEKGRRFYNPLTDKALCFDLMVRYELDLQAPYRPHNETEWEVMYWIDVVYGAGAVKHKNPQRAICLAIIAKHEGK